MKNVLIAMLLVLGVSVSASVFACDAGGHHAAKLGTSTPVTPASAPAK